MTEESKKSSPVMIFGMIIGIGILVMIIMSVFYKGEEKKESPPVAHKHLPPVVQPVHSHEDMDELPPLPPRFVKYENQLPQPDEETMELCIEKLSETVLTPETIKSLLAKIHEGDPMVKLKETWLLEIITESAGKQEGGKFNSFEELRNSVNGVLFQEMRGKIQKWNQDNFMPEMRPKIAEVISEVMSGFTSEKMGKLFSKLAEEGEEHPSDEELDQIRTFLQSRNRQIIHPKLQEKLQPLIEMAMMDGGYGQAVIRPLIQGELDTVLEKFNNEGKLKSLISAGGETSQGEK